MTALISIWPFVFCQ